jgi:hypothetical protein
VASYIPLKIPTNSTPSEVAQMKNPGISSPGEVDPIFDTKNGVHLKDIY